MSDVLIIAAYGSTATNSHHLSSTISFQLESIIEKIPNSSGVDLESLKNVVVSPSDGDTISARFQMDISSKSSIASIKKFVNDRLQDQEIFIITGEGIKTSTLTR